MKRITAILLMMVMLVPYMAYGQESATRSAFTDIQGHWAEETIIKWSNMGLVNGQSADRFNPNASITRAELAALINKVADISGEAAISFTDVASNKWYYTDVAKAVSAGYMQGYADGTFKPAAPITRQELAVLITRLLGITEQEPDAAYTDVINAPAWSKGAIGAMIDSGIMSGKSAGQFSPLASSTRAEAVVILDRIGSSLEIPEVPALTVTYDEAGTYGGEAQETVEGAVVISAEDIILQNTTVSGDLTITADVGEGDVTLRGVTVRGRTFIQGGGENSIHFEGSTLGQVEVNKAGGKVRITFDEASEAELVRLQSPTKIEAAEGSEVEEVELGQQLPTGAEIVLDGSFKRVVVGSQQSNITTDNGTIGTFQVKKEAKGSKVALGRSSKVTQLTLDSGTSVTGEGSVDKAAINAEGSTLSKKPGNVVVADGVQASVGGSTVGGSTTTPPAVGGGGGGGGFVPNPGNPGGGGGVTPQPGSYTITGTIRDISGDSLTGYTLVVFGDEQESYYQTQISNGSFTIALPAGEYSISEVYRFGVDGQILDMKWIDNHFEVSASSSKQLRLIAHNANAFFTMVFPKDVDEELEYVLILQNQEDEDLFYVIYSETAEAIRYVKPGKYSVDYLSGEGYVANIGSFEISNRADVTVHLPALTEGAVNVDGKPLAEGEFIYTNEHGIEQWSAIADGKFKVRLPDGDYTDVKISYTASPSGAEVEVPLDNFTVRASNSDKLSYELNSPVLQGTLLDEEGYPVEGWLQFVSAGHKEFVYVLDGRFAVIQLPNGEYFHIEYSDDQGNKFPIDGNFTVNGEQPVIKNLTKKINVQGEFSKSGAPLDGVVFNVQRYFPSQGLPMPVPEGGLAEVYVNNGGFAFYLPDGEYVIYSYQDEHHSYPLVEPYRFTVSLGSSEPLMINLPGPNVTGVLYEVDGRTPLAEGTLSVRSEGSMIMYSSDITNGQYELSLPNGNYNPVLTLSDRQVVVGEKIQVVDGQPVNHTLQSWALPPLVQINISLAGDGSPKNFNIGLDGEVIDNPLIYRVENGRLDVHMQPGQYIIRSYQTETGHWSWTYLPFNVPGDTVLTIPTVQP